MHLVDRVVHVGLDLHVVREGHVDHPLELLVPGEKLKLISESNNWNIHIGTDLKRKLYPNFLLYQLPGIVNLLRGATNCEHFDTGIRVRWGIPL